MTDSSSNADTFIINPTGHLVHNSVDSVASRTEMYRYLLFKRYGEMELFICKSS